MLRFKGDLLPRDDQLFEVPAQLSIDFDELLA